MWLHPLGGLIGLLTRLLRCEKGTPSTSIKGRRLHPQLFPAHRPERSYLRVKGEHQGENPTKPVGRGRGRRIRRRAHNSSVLKGERPFHFLKSVLVARILVAGVSPSRGIRCYTRKQPLGSALALALALASRVRLAIRPVDRKRASADGSSCLMHTQLLCVTVDCKLLCGLLCGLHPGSPRSGVFGFPSLPIPGGGEAESSVASLEPLSGWKKTYLYLQVCVPIPLR